ncbi:MAG: DUF167 domain-containing protein [Bacillota bacterium]
MSDNLFNLFHEDKNGITFRVRVTPRASANAIAGLAEGALRVRITAPPVEGRANEALLKYLAGFFGIPVRRLAILRGESGREKIIKVEGIVRTEAVERLRQVFGRQE